MDAAKRGEEALSAGNHEKAIEHYTDAIKQSPTGVTYYIKRSAAHQRSNQLEHALADAEQAVVLATKRAKRELIADAQNRRMVVLFNMERYADAEYVSKIVRRLNEKDKTLGIWESKIKAKLGAESGQGKTLSEHMAEVPSVSSISQTNGSLNESKTPAQPSPQPTSKPSAPEVVQTPPSKVKHDWYQNNEKVTLTILAKGVPKEKATIDIQEHSVSISYPTQAGTDYELSLDPLFASIDTADSSFTITAHKIELILKKTTPGVKWKALEGDEVTPPTNESSNGLTNGNEAIKTAVLPNNTKAAPAYPTSSRSGAKNWDKVVDDLTRKPKKNGEEDTGGDEELDLDE
ncbi:hypothetical protein LTS18_013604, partial [Coniosporium uncinatum]